MCAQLDDNGSSVMVTAQRLIATRRKVRFGAHCLIVHLSGERFGRADDATGTASVTNTQAPLRTRRVPHRDPIPQGDTPRKIARMLRHAAKREAVIWAPKHPGPPGASLTTGEGRLRSQSRGSSMRLGDSAYRPACEGRLRSQSWGTSMPASVTAARTSARVAYCMHSR